MIATKDQERNLCSICKVKPCASIRKSVMGFKRYAKTCSACGNHKNQKRKGTPKGRTPNKEQEERSVCPICNRNLVKKHYNKTKLGFTTYYKACHQCLPWFKQKSYAWSQHKETTCSECGFIPVHRRQLDIHHVDNNKKNNQVENLITLCANCHRLKHIPNR